MNRLLKIEQWLRSKFKSRRQTRQIEQQRQYMRDFHESCQFLKRLQQVDQDQKILMDELKKRFGLWFGRN